MKRILEYVWPVVGLIAVCASIYLLYREFKGESVGPAVWADLKAIPSHRYALAALSTLGAYVALAWYDRIALIHLHVRHISWLFISLCSFTTYALSHNIGASVFSGAMVRYRAYTSKGLSATEIAVLVALCSFTFGLGTVLLGGIVLTFEPEQLSRLHGLLPAVLTNETTATILGVVCLAFVALYVIGSILRLRPLILGGSRLERARRIGRVRILLYQGDAKRAAIRGARGATRLPALLSFDSALFRDRRRIPIRAAAFKRSHPRPSRRACASRSSDAEPYDGKDRDRRLKRVTSGIVGFVSSAIRQVRADRWTSASSRTRRQSAYNGCKPRRATIDRRARQRRLRPCGE